MRHHRNGAQETRVTATFRNQKPQQHPKRRRTVLSFFPPGTIILLKDELPKAASIVVVWILTQAMD